MLPIFTWDPDLPYEPELVDDDIVSTFAGSGAEQRSSVLSRGMLRFPLTFNNMSLTDRDAMKAFFRARRGRVGAFYFRDRTGYVRTAVPLTPSSDGATLAFDLPVGDEFGGDYPIDDANVALYRAAILNGGALSADTDGRQIVTDAAPAAGGAAMTADYWYYRRVRFETNRWSESLISWAGGGRFRVRTSLLEVPAGYPS